jgi:CheY-like chemotaxis protein
MRHVLVVEDDPHNAVMFRKLLEKRAGMRVTVSEDPREILALTAGGGVALVIMDVSLAHSSLDGVPVSGLDLTRRIKAEPASALVPVLLATAHAMRGDAERLLADSGADDYISKPIVDHAAFIAQVQGMLGEAA